EHEHLSAEHLPLRRECDKGQVHPIQHQLDRHEDRDDIPLDEKSQNSAREKDAAEQQIIGKRNHQTRPLSPGAGVSSRVASTTAPMMAIRTRTDVTSNGSRKS